jgi:hypothetical protein
MSGLLLIVLPLPSDYLVHEVLSVFPADEYRRGSALDPCVHQAVYASPCLPARELRWDVFEGWLVHGAAVA